MTAEAPTVWTDSPCRAFPSWWISSWMVRRTFHGQIHHVGHSPRDESVNDRWNGSRLDRFITWSIRIKFAVRDKDLGSNYERGGQERRTKWFVKFVFTVDMMIRMQCRFNWKLKKLVIDFIFPYVFGKRSKSIIYIPTVIIFVDKLYLFTLITVRSSSFNLVFISWRTSTGKFLSRIKVRAKMSNITRMCIEDFKSNWFRDQYVSEVPAQVNTQTLSKKYYLFLHKKMFWPNMSKI